MNHLSHPDVKMRQLVLEEEEAVTIILMILWKFLLLFYFHIIFLLGLRNVKKTLRMIVFFVASLLHYNEILFT